MGKMKDLVIAEIDEEEEAAEAAEAAYVRACERGEICPGCDCSKKPREEYCPHCSGQIEK